MGDSGLRRSHTPVGTATLPQATVELPEIVKDDDLLRVPRGGSADRHNRLSLANLPDVHVINDRNFYSNSFVRLNSARKCRSINEASRYINCANIS